jgi:hypothetical protein
MYLELESGPLSRTTDSGSRPDGLLADLISIEIWKVPKGRRMGTNRNDQEVNSANCRAYESVKIHHQYDTSLRVDRS